VVRWATDNNFYISLNSAAPSYALWAYSTGLPPSGGTTQKDIPVSPSNTVVDRWWAPFALTVTGIAVYMFTPGVTAGTYTAAFAGAGNNLLAAATFDLTSLVAGTLTALPLTGVSADLALAADALVTGTFASNNGDLTGAGLYWRLLYQGT